MIDRLQEGSMFAADRRPIWCFNWYNNITIINNNVAADGKKVYMCAMQQSCKEEINFVFYFSRSTYRFCLFADFIERLMLLFIILLLLSLEEKLPVVNSL